RHRHRYGEEEIEPDADQRPGCHAADHQEFALREIDDAGEAEDQRNADPDEDGDARHRQAVYQLLKEDFHIPCRSGLMRLVRAGNATTGERDWERAGVADADGMPARSWRGRAASRRYRRAAAPAADARRRI